MRFLIVQDYKENRRKCTLTPIAGRPGITIIRLSRPTPGKSPGVLELGDGILLHPEAPALSPADRGLVEERPLVVVDSTWARVAAVLRRLRVRSGAQLWRRSIPLEVVTAYPRVSKLHADPPGGLASIEAIFTATVILGEARLDLFSDYRWAGEFLERNRRVLTRFD